MDFQIGIVGNASDPDGTVDRAAETLARRFDARLGDRNACGFTATPADILVSAQLKARDYFDTIDHPVAGPRTRLRDAPRAPKLDGAASLTPPELSTSRSSTSAARAVLVASSLWRPLG